MSAADNGLLAVGDRLSGVVAPLLNELAETKAKLIMFKDKADKLDTCVDVLDRALKRNTALDIELEVTKERKRIKTEECCALEKKLETTAAERDAVFDRNLTLRMDNAKLEGMLEVEKMKNLARLVHGGIN